MGKSEYNTLIKELKAHQFAPVYFFCGEESYFVDELVRCIEEEALSEAEKAFNQTILYGKEIDARRIVETCRRLPMMAERQVVIVKEAQALSMKDDEEKQYLSYLKRAVTSTVLVFAWRGGAPDGRKSFTREIKKTAVYFESKKLYENQVIPWVKEKVVSRKHTITDEAAMLVVDYIGTNLSTIANELEKLLLNKSANTAIDADDVERLIGISKEFNVFELSNAIGTGDRARAYRIVHYFCANPKSGPLALVLGTLYNFFAKVYQIHFMRNLPDGEVAGALKIKPFFVKDYKTAMRNYSLDKIEHIFYLLEEYDLRYKGVGNQGVEEGELLKEMIYKMMAR